MPQPRKYANDAERVRAFRARKALAVASTPNHHTPGYQHWRKELARASEIVNAVYEEVNDWMQERSERWQESDRADEVRADYGRLEEALEAFGALEALR